MKDLIVVPYDILQQLVNMAEERNNTCEAVVEAKALLSYTPFSQEALKELGDELDARCQEYIVQGNELVQLDGHFSADDLELIAYLMNHSPAKG